MPPLSKEEWKRRATAAAALHGLTLDDLTDLGLGLPKKAAARAGQDSDSYQPNHALAMVLAEKLELPVAWFEAEDWRSVVGGASPQLQEIQKSLALVRAVLCEMQPAEFQQALEDLQVEPAETERRVLEEAGL